MFDTLNGNVIVKKLVFVYLLIVHDTAIIAILRDMIAHTIVDEAFPITLCWVWMYVWTFCFLSYHH